VVSVRAGRRSWLGLVWLLLGALYLVVPLVAMAKFSVENGFLGGWTFDAYRETFEDPKFRDTLWLSAKLAIETTVISLLLMIPTAYWVHLKLPRLKPLFELIAVLPYVVPPIVLIVGLTNVYSGSPEWFYGSTRFLVAAYVVLSFTFTWFALDAGLRSIDIHTLTEAAQRMGEFTIATIMLYDTFPTYIYYIGQTKANPAAALSLISFAILFVAMLGILLLGRGRGGRGIRLGAGR
jgi:putative spermidine/putrescine transport system permease protein